MTISINYIKSKDLKNTKNLALFSDEKFKILNLKILELSNQNLIKDLIHNNNEKKKELFVFKFK